MTDSNNKRYVYWCRNCGVPLLQPRCGNCGEAGTKTVSNLRPVFEEEKHLLEQFTEVVLPEQTTLLWMNHRTLWYNGQRYLKLTGNGKPQIQVRYPVTTDPQKNSQNITAEVILAANRATLCKLEEDAINFINETTSQFSQCLPVVSFSGGKDSVVVSHLVRKALNTEAITHIFGDTNNELPHTYRFVELFTNENKRTPLFWGHTNRDWFDMCNILQPPSRITAWCCSVFKSSSIVRAIQSVPTSGKVLCFEGVRRSESSRRQNRPAIATRNKIARQILARPILDWKDIDVWIYTLANNLPINMAYRFGLSRVGCLYCPHHTARVDWWLEQICPNEMKKWKNYIIEYAKNTLKKLDPEDYWTSGAWKARVGNNGTRPRGSLEIRPCIDDESKNFLLQRNFDAKWLGNLLRPFGQIEETEISGGHCFKVSHNGKPLFLLWGVDGLPRAKLTVLEQGNERAITLRVTRQLRKFQACVYCGVCEVVCQHGAILVNPAVQEYIIDEQLCTHCMECVDGKRIKSGCVAINTSYGKFRQTSLA